MDNHLHNKAHNDTVAKKIVLSGKVQGVGFRPFIYRLATQHHLTGWVQNCLGLVEIHAQGDAENVHDFLRNITVKNPPLSAPIIDSETPVAHEPFPDFRILQSNGDGEAHISLPADLNLCDDCLRELNDTTNRRYRYPFINCTQCGPRYTLITRLPYDRPNTTMADFPLCEACQAEYEDPSDRRFHAEPIACPECGPTLRFHQSDTVVKDSEVTLTQAIEALRNGAVVAVKGIGGYHLMCDATNREAVARLRKRKPRPNKPLAVMFPTSVSNPFEQLEQAVQLSQADKAFLQQPSRPILLLPKHNNSTLCDGIAPGLNEIGVMLPYSPLHHLLLNEFDSPLVATSANISGEPVLTEPDDVEQRLAKIADAFLHHNRPIERPADDPVYRPIAGKPRPIRTGRGAAPMEIALPFKLDKPVLAVGTQMKNVITLAWEDRAVISPHIGEMQNARTFAVFEETIHDLQRLYTVTAEQIVCDAHPGYTASRWAEKQSLPVTRVWHHHAHASAAYADCNTNEEMIAFTWDGVGLGDDKTLWGGEALTGRPGEWQRAATFRPFSLPGGDKAGREPWRSAAALCWEAGLEYEAIPETDPFIKHAWQQKLNTPQTSSVGRLFDAATALTGLCTQASFEGQGAMMLEAVANGAASYTELPLLSSGGLLVSDWQPLLEYLRDEQLSVNERAGHFHTSLAHALLCQAQAIRERHNIHHVSLSGGVFQNRRLTELVIQLLTEANFMIHYPELIPVNDAGVSFGQVIEYGYLNEG